MRILLVQPPKAASTIGGEDLYIYEPLALEYVAAGVAGDHDVRILDMRLDRDLRRALDDWRPEVVGFTAYTVHVNVVRRLAEQVKGWNREVTVVVGGHHATVRPEDFLTPSVDVVVMGEGVRSFGEILRRLEAGKDLAEIPGTASMRSGEAVLTPGEPVVDLDAFPLPRRDLTAGCRRHYHSEWMRPLASMRTSKGCPFRCSFCGLWKLTGGRYLTRKPENVVRELAEIAEEFVFFADDESLVDAQRMKTLAGLIKEAGIRKRYFLYGRSDTISRHPELIEMWRNVGLERVFVGLEFFRDDDLNYVKKGTTSSDNEAALRILQGLGIEVYASFIVRPDFRREDFRAYWEYCRRLQLGFATFSVLTPLPGTDFYEEVEEQLIDRNYDHVDFLHTLLPTALPLRDFYEELSLLYRKARPTSSVISFLRRIPLREMPSLIWRSQRVFSQIRHAYRDQDAG